MRYWQSVFITPHAIERYIQRVKPGLTTDEAEATIRAQLEVATKAGNAVGGGVAWALPSPLAYAVIGRNHRQLVLKTILLPEQLKQGRELLQLQDVAAEAQAPMPVIEAPAAVSDTSNVRNINSDGDMIRTLESVLKLAREGKLVGVAVVYQGREDHDCWFRYVLVKGCSAAAMVGELALAQHVMVTNYASRSCF